MSTLEAGPRRLHVITWGCQMNVYDSAPMADVLAPLGYAPAPVPEGADMVILNTCHIRDKAAEKVFSELGRLRRLKEQRAADGGRMILAVAGCVAQAEGAEILARAPYVDIVLGPQTYHRLPEMVARAARAGGAVIETDFPAEDKFDHLPDAVGAAGGHRVPDHPGGLRQVLQLLRRALHARRRAEPAGGGGARRGAAAGRAGRARDHAARPERQRLAWRGAGRRRLGPRPAAAASWRNCPACCGCATRRRIRATWTTR